MIAALRAALGAALCVTCGGCCLLGTSYGPSRELTLVAADGARLAGAAKDGSLSLERCRALCDTSEQVEGCSVATMGDPTVRRVQCAYGPGHMESVALDEAFDASACEKYCGGSVQTCQELPAGPPGELVLACLIYRPGGCRLNFAHGRRTRVVRARRSGDSLSRMAHGEAASVHAFEEMAGELTRFGAPSELVAWARRSAREEAQHAAALVALGAERPRPERRRVRARSLYAFARENLREGVIGETVGVAFLLHAAEHAPNARLRRTFARLARDEARHAELSFAVHRWAQSRLSAAARRRLSQTRVAVSAGAVDLGFPDDHASAAIVAALQQRWFAPSLLPRQGAS